MQDETNKDGPPRGGLSRLERTLMGIAMALGAVGVVVTLIGSSDSVSALTGTFGF